MTTATFEIAGMTCDACARQIEQALLRVPGVQAADESYPRGTAHVTGDTIQAAVLTGTVITSGYGATPK